MITLVDGFIHDPTSCPFFEWVDDPTCPRLGSIIRGLLNSKNRLENKVRDLEDDLPISEIIRNW
ncbi:hypothetical protein M8C21_029154, partial [Ambrosia artemisiifolia]